MRIISKDELTTLLLEIHPYWNVNDVRAEDYVSIDRR